jgi:hypothetical protein
VIGTSKLLHFVSPENYPIWDSKVYAFVLEEKAYHASVNNVFRYLDFIELLKNIKQKDGFADFHASVNKDIGYDVTAMRAIEIVMFQNAPKF